MSDNEKLDDRLRRNLSDMSRALFEAETALTAAEARIKMLSEALQMALDHDALDGSPQALDTARKALTGASDEG